MFPAVARAAYLKNNHYHNIHSYFPKIQLVQARNISEGVLWTKTWYQKANKSQFQISKLRIFKNFEYC